MLLQKLLLTKAARELAAANAQREKAAAEAKAVADAEAKAAADKAIADQAAIDAAALATSPTDVSNVYDFYETDPVVGYTADDLNLGIGAVDPVTTTTTSPTDDSNVYDFYEPDISLDAVSTTTYPEAPPDPILPDDRGYPDVYDPTPFEGPATDDDLGLTDAPISDYSNTEDPYSSLTFWTPRLMMTLDLTPMMILIFLVLMPTILTSWIIKRMMILALKIRLTRLIFSDLTLI
jgi:hypothetical protein